MNKKEDNIINFPKEKFYNPGNIQSQEDFLKQITEYKTSFANDISESLSEYVFGELARSGVNFDDKIDELFTSMLLVTEAIQSLHMKSSGIYHPLQDFAEDVFPEDGFPEEEETELLVDSSEEMDYNTDNKDE